MFDFYLESLCFKYSFNYATWQCAVHGFSSIKNLAMIRKQLFKTRLSKSKGMLPKRSALLIAYKRHNEIYLL